jgi:L-lactate dehydrogenase complex protein LldE
MRASLFVTCLLDLFYPHVGEDVVAVLRRLGVTVDFPAAQTCCGQPAFNTGYRDDARALAKHFIRTFAEAEAIVTPSGSCAYMVCHEYPRLFADEPHWFEESRAIAARTYEFSQFLVDVLGVEDVGAAYDSTVTYHDACHLARGLGVREQPRRLLRAVRGLKLVEMERPDWCCGFGGTFAVRMAEISGGLLEQKIARIEDSAAPVVVTSDAGCIAHIRGGLSRRGSSVRVKHLAQILARSGGAS